MICQAVWQWRNIFQTAGWTESCRLKRNIAIIAALTLVCWLFAASAICVAAPSNTAALSKLEERLFFKTYSQEQVASRLSRLEKRVFGDIFAGSEAERIKRLLESQNAPLNPFAQATNESDSAVTADQAVPSPSKKEASVRKDSEAGEPDEQDCAINRARVAVRAVKDQEITSLLASGVELWRAGRAQEASDKFEQVIRLDASNAQAHFSLGVIEESQGSYFEAAASYQKALRACPNNKEYKEAFVAADSKANSKQAAMAQRAELSRLAENANASFKRGEYLAALDMYKLLDKKAPHQALVKYNLGTIFLVLKQPQRALAYYQEACQIKPGDPRYQQAYQKLQADESLSQPGASVATPQQASRAASAQANQTASSQSSEQANLAANFNALTPACPPGNGAAMASFGILGKTTTGGVMITTIGLASKALRAGLQRGDIIRAVDGTAIKNTSDLNAALAHKAPGQQVKLVVQRAKNWAQVNL